MKHPLAPMSSTEANLGRSCLRKWAAKYCSPGWKVEEDESKYITGRKLHGRAEAYAKHGAVDRTPDPIGDMFLAALPHMPAPKTHYSTEMKMQLELGGVPWEFTADWYGPSDVVPGAPKGLLGVTDYKTCKSFDHAIEGDGEKLDDVQTIVYSHALFGKAAGIFRHLYVRKTRAVLAIEAQGQPDTDGKRARAVARQPLAPKVLVSDVVLQPRQVSDAIERIALPVGAQLYAIRSKGVAINPLDLPPNAGHCSDYGGCPHRQRCNLTAADHIAALGGYDMTAYNLFATLPSINGPSAAAAPAAPAFSFNNPPPPAPVAPPVQLPPGFSQSEQNPEFCKNDASGAYAKIVDVQAQYAAYLAAQQAAAVPAPVVQAVAAVPQHVTHVGLPGIPAAAFKADEQKIGAVLAAGEQLEADAELGAAVRIVLRTLATLIGGAK